MSSAIVLERSSVLQEMFRFLAGRRIRMFARLLGHFSGLIGLADADIVERFGQRRGGDLGLHRVAASQDALFDVRQSLLRVFCVGRERQDSLEGGAGRLQLLIIHGAGVERQKFVDELRIGGQISIKPGASFLAASVALFANPIFPAFLASSTAV